MREGRGRVSGALKREIWAKGRNTLTEKPRGRGASGGLMQPAFLRVGKPRKQIQLLPCSEVLDHQRLEEENLEQKLPGPPRSGVETLGLLPITRKKT